MPVGGVCVALTCVHDLTVMLGSQPSELRFVVVRAVGRGIAVLDWGGGPRRARRRGGLGRQMLHRV